MQLTSLSLALTRAGLGGFSPSSLFLYGEQGVWYEPSLTNGTCFQDAAGTTPVTAVEQPVGLMLDKSKGLVLGPELVTNGDFATDSGWTKNAAVTIAGGAANFDGVTSVNAATYLLRSSATIAIQAGKTYAVTYTIIGGTTQSISVGFVGAAGTPRIAAGTYTDYIVAPASGMSIDVQARITVGPRTGAIDNISVRELPGNHATQTTSTSRPVLSARYNLLTKTEQVDDAVWVKGAGVTVSANAATAPDGTNTADQINNPLGNVTSSPAVLLAAGVGYVFSAWMKSASGANETVSLSIAGAGNTAFTVTSEWQQFSVTWASASAGSWNGRIGQAGQIFNIYIWGASIVPANQASIPYQRVNTAADYDADPAKFKPYLKFDGVDDFLVTNSIDFTSTDKMTVFAGVRKLSDAAFAGIAELSSDPNTVNGSFSFGASLLRGGDRQTWAAITRGTANCQGGARVFAAPDTKVASVLFDIGAITPQTEAVLRLNAVSQSLDFLDSNNAGTGNYGNYPLYIGRRGGTTLPFNGQIYSLIVRGAQTSDTQVSQTETWVNQRTGGY